MRRRYLIEQSVEEHLRREAPVFEQGIEGLLELREHCCLHFFVLVSEEGEECLGLYLFHA